MSATTAYAQRRATILAELARCPRTAAELADRTRYPLHRVQADLRALRKAGRVSSLDVAAAHSLLWLPCGEEGS